METISRATADEFNALVGRTIDAHFQDKDYWHLSVELRCTDGQSLIFSTEDVGIAKYFEVFPIKVKVEPASERAWESWCETKAIQAVIPLLREEWLEPSAPHPELVGRAPHHVHHAGRGPAPTEAVQRAVVQAGVRLQFSQTESIVIYASDAAPFNVEIALSQSEVESTLGQFSAPEA